MIVDLHNHTKLCNHAEGEMDEYVEKAVENGCKYFGFSEHAPMEFDKKYRLSFANRAFYEKGVRDLKEKYKNQVEILLAYEVDFLKGFMEESILNADVDYLIGSVHFLNKWSFDNPEFIGEYKNKNIDLIWEDYFEQIKLLAKSNKFNIIGHIDLLKVFKFLPKKDIRLIAKEAIVEIKKSNMVVELNVAGYRKPISEAYPSDAMLELIAENNIQITFGSDAHSPSQVGYKRDEIYSLAKKYGYNKCIAFIKKEKREILF